MVTSYDTAKDPTGRQVPVITAAKLKDFGNSELRRNGVETVSAAMKSRRADVSERLYVNSVRNLDTLPKTAQIV